ncbi:quorum sensing histidine kinase QseC [Rodentibacter caecimuris]|uniref:Sensor protein QseC n=1 Tax=Rodentibacter caecimuris TaxID=1796644 RepID=A0ABX3KZN3_9PAST|nr:two-component system sensor histidine kinase QseC [Rodentibacter heylii]
MKLSTKSLRLRLIFILSVSALFIWSISTVVAWFQVRKEINKMFDAQQILFAQRLAFSDLRFLLHVPSRSRTMNQHRLNKQAKFDDDALAFAVFNSKGEMLLSDGLNGENFIFTPKTGFSTAEIRGDEDKWRIFWQPAKDGRLIIAVGQELEYREELINDMVFGQMWIWFASLPLLLAVLIFGINKELSILRRISRQVQQRVPDDDSLFVAHNIPTEILPLIENLNAFFDRTSSLLSRERRFTADAAHELRSPLAALRIQAEVAQIVSDDEKVREQALANLTVGIDRASQLIEQLLTLSRLDNLKELSQLEEINWTKLIPSQIGELYFSAQKRQINLSFEQQDIPCPQRGQPLLLALMLRNLIDNAVKYCPQGSRVVIYLTATAIRIEDNGGGVADEYLDKLAQRFFRPPGQNEKGSGLGLSIVRRIAELHHYRFELENIKIAGKIVGLRANIFFR